jgi:subtilisin family serine protease
VEFDTFELTRLYARCLKADSAAAAAAARQRCEAIRQDYDKQKQEAEQLTGQVQMIGVALARAVQILQRATGADSLTADRVRALQPSGAEQTWAKQAYLQLADNGITPEELEDTRKAIETRVKYHLDASYDPRPIVGDRYDDVSERRYGNRDVMGPDATHGTHVAGIVGAVRGNGVGVDGVAPAVRIMSVRTVPDGDERDKDVANAIRYAVDQGAHVINMSFGKNYSPQKGAVDEAVKYADSRGVLMVHGSGNDGENVATTPDFPTPVYLDGTGRARSWIEVGASSWKGGDSLAAPFSNWGTGVDVFAPGVDILSTIPGGGYKRESGTSMAAPVVSGLAALLMAYYPELSAAAVKQIIVASATRYGAQQVVRPGSDGERVPFGSLSASGGIANAYNAVRMAEQLAAPKP